ncbi:MAG: filamentous hemagglutinin N-terminal domain-containing protein, partial [Aquisalimonadaceae bacterium]
MQGHASLNRVYRLVWNQVLGLWQVASELTRGKSKGSGSRRLKVAATTVALLSAGGLHAGGLPSGGQVTAGSGSISQSGSQMTIEQSSDRLALDWQDFSIGKGAQVDFVQPSSASIALNRVIGSDVSVIQGALNANGQVMLINPNGVLFSGSAQVDVGGLVASTLTMSNEDFLAGNYNFTGASSNAVINQGAIQAAAGGYVALIAARIENTGTIAVPDGSVLMGAGSRVTLDLGGPVKLEVEEAAIDALIQQGGGIRVDGGLVYLTASAAGDLAATVINQTGVIEAQALSADASGRIVLLGEGGGVDVAGTLDTRSEFGQGGQVSVTGEDVNLLAGARIDASGMGGGGEVLIGGGYQGNNTDVRNARTTSIDSDASIHADALIQGDGGTVIVWADEQTDFFGEISARGGEQGGDGGFAEVSGKRLLNYQGQTDLRAPLGQTGTLLLDPYNITIQSMGPDSTDLENAPFTASEDDSILTVSTLQNALGSANVTVSTGAGGGQEGNITLADTVGWFSGTKLTLDAANNITVNADLFAINGSIDFQAGGGISQLGGTEILVGGATVLSAGAGGISLGSALNEFTGSVTATTATGDITLSNDRNLLLGDFVAGGAVTLATGSNGFIQSDVGRTFEAGGITSLTSDGTGNITLGSIVGQTTFSALSTKGGNITLTGDDGLLFTETVATTALEDTGIASGTVTITAVDDIEVAGRISTEGADNATGVGSNAAAVNLTSVNGSLIVGEISTDGGDAVSAGPGDPAPNRNGGNAGNISLQASADNAGTITLNGDFFAIGGDFAGDSTQGLGGFISVRSPSILTADRVMTTGDTAGNIVFESTIDSDTSARQLTLSAGLGSITLDDSVGGIEALSGLVTTSQAVTRIKNNVTTNSAVGVDVTSTTIRLGNDDVANGDGTMTIDTQAGDGVITLTTPNTYLDDAVTMTRGAGAITLSNNLLSNDGERNNLTFNGVNGGAVSVGGDVGGASAGAATRLGDIAIDSVTDLSLDQNVSAASLISLNGTGKITLATPGSTTAKHWYDGIQGFQIATDGTHVGGLANPGNISIRDSISLSAAAAPLSISASGGTLGLFSALSTDSGAMSLHAQGTLTFGLGSDLQSTGGLITASSDGASAVGINQLRTTGTPNTTSQINAGSGKIRMDGGGAQITLNGGLTSTDNDSTDTPAIQIINADGVVVRTVTAQTGSLQIGLPGQRIAGTISQASAGSERLDIAELTLASDASISINNSNNIIDRLGDISLGDALQIIARGRSAGLELTGDVTATSVDIRTGNGALVLGDRNVTSTEGNVLLGGRGMTQSAASTITSAGTVELRGFDVNNVGSRGAVTLAGDIVAASTNSGAAVTIRGTSTLALGNITAGTDENRGGLRLGVGTTQDGNASNQSLEIIGSISQYEGTRLLVDTLGVNTRGQVDLNNAGNEFAAIGHVRRNGAFNLLDSEGGLNLIGNMNVGSVNSAVSLTTPGLLNLGNQTLFGTAFTLDSGSALADTDISISSSGGQVSAIYGAGDLVINPNGGHVSLAGGLYAGGSDRVFIYDANNVELGRVNANPGNASRLGVLELGTVADPVRGDVTRLNGFLGVNTLIGQVDGSFTFTNNNNVVRTIGSATQGFRADAGFTLRNDLLLNINELTAASGSISINNNRDATIRSDIVINAGAVVSANVAGEGSVALAGKAVTVNGRIEAGTGDPLAVNQFGVQIGASEGITVAAGGEIEAQGGGTITLQTEKAVVESAERSVVVDGSVLGGAGGIELEADGGITLGADGVVNALDGGVRLIAKRIETGGQRGITLAGEVSAGADGIGMHSGAFIQQNGGLLATTGALFGLTATGGTSVDGGNPSAQENVILTGPNTLAGLGPFVIQNVDGNVDPRLFDLNDVDGGLNLEGAIRNSNGSIQIGTQGGVLALNEHDLSAGSDSVEGANITLVGRGITQDSGATISVNGTSTNTGGTILLQGHDGVEAGSIAMTGILETFSGSNTAITLRGSLALQLPEIRATRGTLVLGDSAVLENEVNVGRIEGGITQAENTTLQVSNLVVDAESTAVLANDGNVLETLGRIQSGDLNLKNSRTVDPGAVGLTLNDNISSTGGVRLDTTGILSVNTRNISASGDVALLGIGISQAGASTVNADAGEILVDGGGESINLAGTVTTDNATASALRVVDGAQVTLGTLSAAAGTVTLGQAGGQITDTITQVGVAPILTANTLAGDTTGTVTLLTTRVGNLGPFTTTNNFTLLDQGADAGLAGLTFVGDVTTGGTTRIETTQGLLDLATFSLDTTAGTDGTPNAVILAGGVGVSQTYDAETGASDSAITATTASVDGGASSIALGSAGNDFTGQVALTSTGTQVTIRDANELILDNFDDTLGDDTSILAIAGQRLSLAEDNITTGAGNIDFRSLNGTLGTRGNITTGSGDVSLLSSGVLTLNGVVVSTSGDITITGSSIASRSGAGDRIQTSGSGNISLEATVGNFTQGGDVPYITESGDITITALGGSANLASLQSLSGALVVVAGGNVTQQGGIPITVGAVDVTTRLDTGGDITLTSSSNSVDFVSLRSLNGDGDAAADGTIQYLDSAGFAVREIETTGNVTLAGGDDITTDTDIGPGTIIADHLVARTLSDAGADIHLTGANSVSSIDLRARNLANSADAAGGITFTDSDGFDVVEIRTTDDVLLTADGAVSQSGENGIRAAGLGLSGSGSFTLDEQDGAGPTNRVSTFASDATGDVDFKSQFALTIGDVNPSGVTTGGADFTVSAPSIDASSATIDTRSTAEGGNAGAVSMTTTGQGADGNLTAGEILTSGSDAGASTNVDGGDAGQITLTASGSALTIAGAISARGGAGDGAGANGADGLLQTSAASGAVTQVAAAANAIDVGTVRIVAAATSALLNTDNTVDHLAATLGGQDENFTFRNGADLSVGVTDGGVIGLSTDGGFIDLLTTGAITLATDATVTTQGGDFTSAGTDFTSNGGATVSTTGGNIVLDGHSGHVLIGADITTAGGDFTATDIGSFDSTAATVSLEGSINSSAGTLVISTAGSGDLATGALDTRGGVDDGGAGEVGGDISLNAGGVLLTNSIDTRGTVSSGDATAGGRGGNITLSAGTRIDLNGDMNTTGGGAGGTQAQGGNVTLNDQANLLSDVTINTGASAGTVTFQDTLDGSFNLDVAAGTGQAGFLGAVGATDKLALLNVTAGTINLHQITMDTIGAQTYTGDVVLQGDATLTADDADITFTGRVDSDDASMARDLILAAGAGHVSFGGRVGETAALDALDVTAATIKLDGETVETVGAQQYAGAVVLGADTALTATDADIAFAQTVDSASGQTHDLTLATGTGAAILGGAVGNTDAVNTLDVAAASINLAGGTVNTVSTQQYSGAVVLETDTTLTATDADITFNQTVDSALGQTQNLTLATGTGAATFGGRLGNTDALNALEVAAATINLHGETVETAGAQQYAGAVVLGADATLTTTDADITFTGTVDGDDQPTARNLTLATGAADVFLNGAAGSSLNGPLGAVTISSARDVTAAAITADTLIQTAGTGTTILNGAVDLSGNAALAGNAFIINESMTADGSMTVTNAGLFSTAAAGDIAAANGFTQNGLGSSELAGDITTQDAAIAFATDTVLTGDIAMQTLADGNGETGLTASIELSGKIDSDSLSPRSLTLSAGAGGISLGDAVGGTENLGTLSLLSAGGITQAPSAAIIADKLSIQADESVILNNTGNTVDVLAASLLNGADLAYTDSTGFVIGAVDTGLLVDTGNGPESLVIKGLTETVPSGQAGSSSVALIIGGPLTQDVGSTVRIGGNLSIDTTAFNRADVRISNSSVDGTELGETLVGGDFTLDSSGEITQADGTNLRVGGRFDTPDSGLVQGGSSDNFIGDSGGGLDGNEIRLRGVITLEMDGNDLRATAVRDGGGTDQVTVDSTLEDGISIVSDSGVSSLEVTDQEAGFAIDLGEGNDIGGTLSVTTAGTYSADGDESITGILFGGALNLAGPVSFMVQASTSNGASLVDGAGAFYGNEANIFGGAVSISAPTDMNVVLGSQGNLELGAIGGARVDLIGYTDGSGNLPALSQSGQINAAELRIQDFASVTLNRSNRVGVLATLGITDAFSFRFGADHTAGVMNQIGTVGDAEGISTVNGPITLLSAFDFGIAADLNSGTASTTITATGDRDLFLHATPDAGLNGLVLSNAELARITAGETRFEAQGAGVVGVDGISFAASNGSLLLQANGIELAGTVDTVGADLTVDGNVTLTDATQVSTGAASDGDIRFLGTVDSTENGGGGLGHALVLDAGLGDITLNGAVGASQRLASISATAATMMLADAATSGSQNYQADDAINSNGSHVSEGGAISFDGPLLLNSNTLVDTTNAGAAPDGAEVSFTGTVNGAGEGTQGLDIKGDAIFNAAVGGDNALASLEVSGATSLAADVLTLSVDDGSGDQIYGGTLTLTDNVLLDTGAAGGNIQAGSLVGNAHNLTLRSGLGTTLVTDGATGIDTLTLQSDAASSTGSVTVNGLLSANSLITFARAYEVNLQGGDIANAVTFLNTGGVSLGNAGWVFQGGLTSMASVTTLAGSISTDDEDIALDAVLLAGDTVLNSGNGTGNIAVESITGADNDLTLVSGAGTTTVSGNAAGIKDLTVQNDQVTATGAVAFLGDLTAASLTTFGQNHAVVLAGSSVNMIEATTFLNTGALTLGDGASDVLTFAGGLTTTGSASNPGTVTLAGTIATTDTAMMLGEVSLAGDTSLKSGTGTITTAAVTDGGDAHALSLGDASQSGAIMLTGNLSVDALNTFDGAYDVSLTGSANNVESATTFFNTGSLTLGDAASDSNTFRNGLTAEAQSEINLAGTLETVNSAITLGAVTLTADSTLASGSADLTLTDALEGGFSLALNSGGTTNLSGAVGGGSALTALTTDAPGNTTVESAVLNVSGALTFNDGVTFTNNSTVSSDSLVLSSTLAAGANDLTLVTNAISLGGAVTGSGDLVIRSDVADTTIGIAGGAGTLNLDASEWQFIGAGFTSLTLGSAVAGNISIGDTDLVVLSNATTLITGGAVSAPVDLELGGEFLQVNAGSAVTFGGTLNSEAGEANALTVNAGSDAVTFEGSLGQTQALGAVQINANGATLFEEDVSAASLSTSAGGSVSLQNVTTTGAQSYGNDATLAGSYTTADAAFNVAGGTTLAAATTVSTGTGNATFSGAVNGAENLTVNNTGDTLFEAAVGGTAALQSLSTSAGGSVSLQNVTTT